MQNMYGKAIGAIKAVLESVLSTPQVIAKIDTEKIHTGVVTGRDKVPGAEFGDVLYVRDDADGVTYIASEDSVCEVGIGLNSVVQFKVGIDDHADTRGKLYARRLWRWKRGTPLDPDVEPFHRTLPDFEGNTVVIYNEGSTPSTFRGQR